MISFWEIPFIVVDVETTGVNPQTNRIIEIACVTTIGGEIVSKYNSLINPHQLIPPFISHMTGISYEMVLKAPEAEDIFSEIHKILNVPNAVFVAHNASFDWSFVKSTLLRSGFVPQDIPRLCSLKLSRRLLHKNLKKNVGSLAEYFNIPLKNRHRALGDAAATASVLIELLEKTEEEHGITTIEELLNFQNKPIRNFHPPSATFVRVEPILEALPEEPGVYYFLDKDDQILYIGKAKSLRDRVRSYFYVESFTSRKTSSLLKKIHNIVWETTGCELAALILESKEIKRFKPPFNVMSKVCRSFPLIKLSKLEDFPKAEICYSVEDDTDEYYGPFRSISLATNIIQTIDKKFHLRKCDKPKKPNPDNKPCLYYQMKGCFAPCSCLISKDEYHKELVNVQYFLSGFSDGIINQLEEKMDYFAEKLDFERAAALKEQIGELRKIFERRQSVSTSINRNNLVLILPASQREKTLELFFIKTGILAHHETIGRLAPLGNLFFKLHEIFYNGINEPNYYDKENLDELRIISSWLYRQRKGQFFYVEGKEEVVFCTELEKAIRNAEFID